MSGGNDTAESPGATFVIHAGEIAAPPPVTPTEKPLKLCGFAMDMWLKMAGFHRNVRRTANAGAPHPPSPAMGS